jgi:hypothetical protein
MPIICVLFPSLFSLIIEYAVKLQKFSMRQQTRIYQIFTEERNCLTLLLSACEPKMPHHLPRKSIMASVLLCHALLICMCISENKSIV